MPEWSKIEAKPDKDYKVPGRELLDMRNKIAELEKSLTVMTGKTEGIQAALESTVGDKDRTVKSLIEEKNILRENSEKKISDLEAENRKLSEDLNVLKGRLSAMEPKIKSLEQEKASLLKVKEDLELALQSRDFDYFKKFVRERAERASKSDLGLPKET